jgi:hypothetical protein
VSWPELHPLRAIGALVSAAVALYAVASWLRHGLQEDE